MAALFLLSGAWTLSACSGSHSSAPESTGTIAMQLALPDGSHIDSVGYTISGGPTSKAGTVDVSNDGKIDAVVGGLEAAPGYMIALSATSSAGYRCAGQAGPFTVIANATVSIAVVLTCHAPRGTGGVAVTGVVDVCPGIDSIAAVPSAAQVGDDIAVTASASPDESAQGFPLMYTWAGVTSSSGNAATLHCASPGSFPITVSVSNGDPACVTTPVDPATRATITLTCEGDAGAPADGATPDGSGTPSDASGAPPDAAPEGSPDAGVPEGGMPPGLYSSDDTQVHQFNSDGTTGVGTFNLNLVRGLAVDAAGRVYAAGFDGRIYRASSPTQVDALVSCIGMRCAVGATALALGPDGNLYIASNDDVTVPAGSPPTTTGSILRYDTATGAFMGVFASTGIAALNFFSFGPAGMYVSGASSVDLYDGASGAFVKSLVTGFAVPPHAVRFDASNRMYVVLSTNEIRRYDATTGAFIDVFATAGLSNPYDAAFGPDGALYVSNYVPFQDAIWRLDGKTGASLGQFAVAAPSATYLVWR